MATGPVAWGRTAPSAVRRPRSRPPGCVQLRPAPLSTRGRYIVDASGNRFKLRSANWQGTQGSWTGSGDIDDRASHHDGENAGRMPLGLDRAPIGTILTDFHELGINSIRLPFSNEMPHDQRPVATPRSPPTRRSGAGHRSRSSTPSSPPRRLRASRWSSTPRRPAADRGRPRPPGDRRRHQLVGHPPRRVRSRAIHTGAGAYRVARPGRFRQTRVLGALLRVHRSAPHGVWLDRGDGRPGSRAVSSPGQFQGPVRHRRVGGGCRLHRCLAKGKTPDAQLCRKLAD